MAKKSVLFRETLKRQQLRNRFSEKRKALKARVIDMTLSHEERLQASFDLQSIPRNASPVRQKNRCKLCGRPRAYNRLTGLCRLCMRKAVIAGYVPGMHKASW